MPNDSLEELFNRIIDLILSQFSDIVVDVQLRFSPSGSIEKLRIFMIDETFIDVWLSSSGKYSYHWEQRHVRGLIHRHDNAPHIKWKKIKTFPKHFQEKIEDNVKERSLHDNNTEAINYFLSFARKFLKKQNAK